MKVFWALAGHARLPAPLPGDRLAHQLLALPRQGARRTGPRSVSPEYRDRRDQCDGDAAARERARRDRAPRGRRGALGRGADPHGDGEVAPRGLPAAERVSRRRPVHARSTKQDLLLEVILHFHDDAPSRAHAQGASLKAIFSAPVRERIARAKYLLRGRSRRVRLASPSEIDTQLVADATARLRTDADARGRGGERVDGPRVHDNPRHRRPAAAGRGGRRRHLRRARRARVPRRHAVARQRARGQRRRRARAGVPGHARLEPVADRGALPRPRRSSSACRRDMLGRVFDGLGRPRDGGPEIIPEKRVSIYGAPINPIVARLPRRLHPDRHLAPSTGSTRWCAARSCRSSRGRGLPHNELAAQIARQAGVLARATTPARWATRSRASSRSSSPRWASRSRTPTSSCASSARPRAIERAVLFLNLADDPAVERIATPRMALTAAEYLAFELRHARARHPHRHDQLLRGAARGLRRAQGGARAAAATPATSTPTSRRSTSAPAASRARRARSPRSRS